VVSVLPYLARAARPVKIFSRAVCHDILEFCARVFVIDRIKFLNGPTGPIMST
jgi:hypothetical protein